MPQDVSLPSDLDLVSHFVNTRDLDSGEDALATPEGLARWLDGHGLPTGGASRADAERAREFREALRSLLLANNGGELRPEAVATCNDVARRAPLEVVVSGDGRARLEPRAEGVDAALGRILAVVERSQAEGTWDRLKACAASDCHWAYYDRSRNHSRTWCAMSVCGNRAKARAYRQRRP